MALRIQLRRDIASNWTTNNPILLSGELGIETDTARFKIGNGGRWNSITSYAFKVGEANGVASLGPTGKLITSQLPDSFSITADIQAAISALSTTNCLNFYAALLNTGVVFDSCSVTINYFNPNNLLGTANYQTMLLGNFNGVSLSLPNVTARTSTSITSAGLTSLNNIVLAEMSDTISYKVKAFLEGSYIGNQTMSSNLNNPDFLIMLMNNYF